jgi:predicted amidohydrolase
MNRLIVSCLQPRIRGENAQCYEAVESLISLAKSENAEFALLPERWLPFSISSEISKYIFETGGEPVQFLQDCAMKYEIGIITGGIWEYVGGFPKIACYVIDSSGKIVGRQEKIHLYAYEKSFFKPGDTISIFHAGGLCFAVLICFDITFYETPSMAVQAGADILFSPTLIRKEGIRNWKIYLRARALENRVPIVACNSLGEYSGSQYLGLSQIIQFKPGYTSPSKLSIQTMPKNVEAILSGEVNYKFPRRLRRERLAERIDFGSLKVINT